MTIRWTFILGFLASHATKCVAWVGVCSGYGLGAIESRPGSKVRGVLEGFPGVVE